MIELNNYVTKCFEVKCQTGVLASSVDGKLIPTDKFGDVISPDDERYLKLKKKIRAVNKRTVDTYYARIYRAGPGYISLVVLMADHLCRKGLNWHEVYSATLHFKKYDLVEVGSKTLEYWLGRSIPNDLLIPKEGHEEPEGLQIGEIVGIPSFDLFYGASITIETIFKAYEAGAFYGRTGLLELNLRLLPFGIEVEFTGMSREVAAKYVAAFFGTTFSRPMRTSYDRYCVLDKKGRIWSVKSDSSIRNPVNYYNEPADSRNKCELETPILEYDDIETLQNLIRGLRNDRYMRVNSSCGIHVHVGGRFDAVALKNVYNLIASHQKLLSRALKVKKERLLGYCKEVSGDAFKKCTNSALDMEQVKKGWEDYENSRYKFVNFNSFFAGKGIEFRCFNSTTHAGVIKSYIQLSLAICNYAMMVENVRPIEKEKGHDLARMRSWMNKIGLTGEEFKTVRYHLTKNLENKVDNSSSENRGNPEHVA